MSVIGVVSYKMSHQPHLSRLLGGDLSFLTLHTDEKVTKIAGWGLNPRSMWAGRFAKWRNLPFVSVEDGFLHSFELGVSGPPPLSVVVDDVGMYYDATRPSMLENILNTEGWETSNLMRDAEAAVSLITGHQLSKDNNAPDAPLSIFSETGKKRVLVVDQTRGDMSVRFGMADKDSFRKLYETARAENPNADIYIKLHPDVVAGKKLGYLTDIKSGENTFIIRDHFNPLSIIKHVDKVYVVTSQMGFDALLLHKPVTCFGMPFYAGWGVTDDRVSCPRRSRKNTVLQIFAAAYIRYARYIDPSTGRRGSIFHLIHHLIRQKKHAHENEHDYYCIGLQVWKRRYVRPFLQGYSNKVVFVNNAKSALRKGMTCKSKMVVWGNSESRDTHEISERMGIPVLRIEDGFLRSVGLGSDLIRPMSLALDNNGMYYDPRSGSDLEKILNSSEFTSDLRFRAQSLRRRIVEAKITKYNTERHDPLFLRQAPSRKIIFVPGQVEDDVSIRLGTDETRTNEELLRTVRVENPDAFIIYKPHPDVIAHNRVGIVARKVLESLCDHIETSRSVISCIDASDEIHTMTSLSGFDALLRGKKVFVYGKPFYAGWGLTEDRASFPQRTRQLTLDELVAGTLILYPRYWSTKVEGVVEPEAVVETIVSELMRIESEGCQKELQPCYIARQFRKAGNLCSGWWQR